MVVHNGPPVRKFGHILRALLQQMFAKETLNDRPALRKSTGFFQACVYPVNGDAAVLDAVTVGRVVLHDFPGAVSALGIYLVEDDGAVFGHAEAESVPLHLGTEQCR